VGPPHWFGAAPGARGGDHTGVCDQAPRPSPGLLPLLSPCTRLRSAASPRPMQLRRSRGCCSALHGGSSSLPGTSGSFAWVFLAFPGKAAVSHTPPRANVLLRGLPRVASVSATTCPARAWWHGGGPRPPMTGPLAVASYSWLHKASFSSSPLPPLTSLGIPRAFFFSSPNRALPGLFSFLCFALPWHPTGLLLSDGIPRGCCSFSTQKDIFFPLAFPKR